MVDTAASSGLDDDRYAIGKLLGTGSYGAVVKAYDRLSHRHVAIKRIPFVEEHVDAIRITREIRLLHALRCDNVITLFDVELSQTSLYIISEVCETDLHQSIQTSKKNLKPWEPSEYLYVMYQVLNAISFMHSAGVLHRDIKPANILLGANLTVKICDFGLARVLETGANEAFIEADIPNLTEYVVSRWYRAPEIVLVPGRYGKAQDVWATACTFAEMIRKEPLFPGTTLVDQLQVIVDVLGKPTVEDLDFEMKDRVRQYVNGLQSKQTGLSNCITGSVNIHSDLLDLIQKMLVYNPNTRITTAQACELPMFKTMREKLSSLNKSLTTPIIKDIRRAIEDNPIPVPNSMSAPNEALETLLKEVAFIKKDMAKRGLYEIQEPPVHMNIVTSDSSTKQSSHKSSHCAHNMSGKNHSSKDKRVSKAGAGTITQSKPMEAGAPSRKGIEIQKTENDTHKGQNVSNHHHNNNNNTNLTTANNNHIITSNQSSAATDGNNNDNNTEKRLSISSNQQSNAFPFFESIKRTFSRGTTSTIKQSQSLRLRLKPRLFTTRRIAASARTYVSSIHENIIEIKPIGGLNNNNNNMDKHKDCSEYDDNSCHNNHNNDHIKFQKTYELNASVKGIESNEDCSQSMKAKKRNSTKMMTGHNKNVPNPNSWSIRYSFIRNFIQTSTNSYSENNSSLKYSSSLNDESEHGGDDNRETHHTIGAMKPTHSIHVNQNNPYKSKV
eukprot:gene7591-15554_t